MPGVSGSGSVGPELPRLSALRPLSVSCPLFFQLLPWPLAIAASTALRPCPPGEEPNLVSPPCPSASPGKAVEGRGRDPRPGSWLCPHSLPPAGTRAGPIVQVLPPRHLLSLLGLSPMPAPLTLQPSREAQGPGGHGNSRRAVWRLPAWVSHSWGGARGFMTRT